MSMAKREWLEGEKAAWLADKIVTGSSDYCNEASDLLRNYSNLEKELAAYTTRYDPRHDMAVTRLEGYVSGLNGKIRALEVERDALQAKLDRLMLEFCPDEMTQEQLENWENAQHTTKADCASN